MAITLSDDQFRYLHLRSQRLTPWPQDEAMSVAKVVKEMCGIQAQEASAAMLAVRVRSDGRDAAEVEQARVQNRSVVRTWGPRGTLHLLATEDLGWLLPLLGPIFIAGDRRRREQLGLGEDICARGISTIRDILAQHGPLTRAELFERLATQGIHLEGQARPHLLFRAALEGLICLGPDHGAEQTYALLSEWINREQTRPALSEDEAYAELTRRYLSAYGPATPDDQAAWSGMPLSKIRAAWQRIEDELLGVGTEVSPAWMLKKRAAWLDQLHAHPPIVRLLPRFDTYLLGYRDRGLTVPLQYAKRVNAGGGIVHPTVLVDGRVVGTWKSRREKKQFVVMVEPFERFAPEVNEGLGAETEDIGRFLGVRAELRLVEPV